MIQVTAKEIGADIELTFSGHAGFSPRGSDIVCAGISALYCTLIRALKKAGNSTTVHGQKIIVKAPNEIERAIIDTILTGVAGIQRSYPDYVYTAVDTREQTAQSKKRRDYTRENVFGNAVFLQLFAKRGASKAELAARQEGGDTGTQPAETQKREEVFKVYKTKEEYQKHMDEVIGSRLKENREEKERLSRLSDLTQKLMHLFGAKSEGELLEKLSPAIDAAASAQAEAADFEAFKSEIAADLAELSASTLRGRTVDALLDNEDFLRLIGCGLSVGDALDVLNENEEEDVPSDQATEGEKEKPRAAKRPSENALSGAGTARIAKTAEHLTDEDLEDIVRRVTRGEKIRF